MRGLLSAVLIGNTVLVSFAWAQTELEGSRANLIVYRVRPSETDPAIQRFDEPHFVLFDRKVHDDANLVVFLPGTGGKPANAQLLLGVIAAQGYRVIGLEYNDEPAVVAVCPRHPSPKCSGDFREQRIFGGNVTTVVENTQAESIENRLSKLLRHLDHQHPDEHWNRFLANDAPEWTRIVVSGLSQGAGMAAYIAKKRTVARVVLFSSPWDYYGPTKAVAPWISEPSATSLDRWYAAYHRREVTVILIARAYHALKIPSEHIRVFDLDLPPNHGNGDNPYHSSTIRNADYLSQWQFLFGSAN
jgi:hypothetical protein